MSKQQTTLSMCPHEHIAMLLSGYSNSLDLPDEHHCEPEIKDVMLENTSKFLLKNRKVDLTEESIVKVQKNILQMNIEVK